MAVPPFWDEILNTLMLYSLLLMYKRFLIELMGLILIRATVPLFIEYLSGLIKLRASRE